MDYIIEQTLNKLGKSLTELTKSNEEKIYELFPVPREQKILWADVEIGRRISGIVLHPT